jgi:pimeloyl-ACP methyl ester carboxylesterase
MANTRMIRKKSPGCAGGRGPVLASKSIVRGEPMLSNDPYLAGKRARCAPGPFAGMARLLAIAFPLLISGCASIVIHERPIFEQAVLETPTAVASPTAEAAALLQAGVAHDTKYPEWAIAYYRDAALKVLPQVLREGVSPALDIQSAGPAQGVYRRAIEYALETAHRRALKEGVPWTDVLARAGIRVEGKLALYEAASWDEVLPTRRFEVKGFHHQASQGGLGAPVVAHLTRSGRWGEALTETGSPLIDNSEMHLPRSIYRSSSALLLPGTGDDRSTAVLALRDPVLDPEMRWRPGPEGPELPLAYDMTVALGRQFHVANLNLLGALGVLFPSEYDSRTGIYMIDPYERGKIPIVFVHGLMSSPEAWDNAMNDLRGDKELRKHYQFWMFFYSTGNPILASGARFRKSLQDLRSQLDPEGKDPAFDRMVLVGHSMGGLLSRLAISQSGQTLWNTASKVPIEQIELEPELKALLTEALFFEPVPMVSRVVFVSTPHRGSPLGDAFIGQLASRLITVPSDILKIRSALVQYNGEGNVSQPFKGTRYATSVAQLGTGNPVLKVIGELPMSESVAYHSIVGYDGKEPLPAGGDGVVPYTSAHLADAVSELVISSGHSAQEKQEAIVEMRRILTLHVQEYAAEREALARGEPPPPRITRAHGQPATRYALTPRGTAREWNPWVARSDTPLDLRLIR